MSHQNKPREYYHVSLSMKSTLPARMIMYLPMGTSVSAQRFDKLEQDKDSTSYPKKKVWLTKDQATELKQKGFTVRKAKQPKPELPKPRRRKSNGDV